MEFGHFLNKSDGSDGDDRLAPLCPREGNGGVPGAKVLPEGLTSKRLHLVFWRETLLGFLQDGDEVEIICIFPPLIPLLKRENGVNK